VRQSYANWAIAVQDENGLSDEELTPVFIPVSIPVPVTAGSSNLVGEQGVAGLLIKPDGTPASATILSAFSSNELAKNLVREFVLAGFAGCNLGVPSETWTACGLDITFVAPNGNRGTTTANAGNTSANGATAGNPNGTGNPDRNNASGNPAGGRDSANAGNAGNAGNASADNPAGQSGAAANTSTTPSELTALLEGIEPNEPIAIAITEAIPTYRDWRTQAISNLGEDAQGLVFRAVPSELPYPDDLNPAFDRSLATTAIVSLALKPDLTVVPETASVLRSSGNDQLDAIALGFAEATPRDWYANNLELDGTQGAIVLFTLSFVTPEGDSAAPPDPNTDTSNPDNPEPTSEVNPDGASGTATPTAPE
ncbi:MAG: hypothetical protein EAZ61_02605, partial [Oscillatoriales cyanobacterium]